MADARAAQRRLTVCGGEILGIAGVAGNGQSLLAELTAGLVEQTSGKSSRSTDTTTAALDALNTMYAGVRYVPEDRMRVGLVPQLDLAHNLILRDYRRRPYGNGFWIDWQQARPAPFADGDGSGTGRTPSLDANAATLSAAISKSFCLGGSFAAEPRLLFVAQPTRGLDLEACASITAAC